MENNSRSELRFEITSAESAEDREAIFRFRYRVFVEEMGRADLEGVDHERRIIADEFDERGAHFLCRAGDRIVGALRISDAAALQSSAELSSFFAFPDILGVLPAEEIGFTNWLMVAAAHHGSRVAGLLFDATYRHALATGMRIVLAFCKPGVVNLYERLGLEQYQPPRALGDIGLRVPLLLLIRDEAHLRAVRSPLHRALAMSAPGAAEGELRQLLAARFPRLDPRAPGDDELWRQLSATAAIADRRRPGLFDGLSDGEIRALCKHTSIISCEAGREIIRPDETSAEMFVILSGRFAVRSRRGEVIDRLGKGDVFGEIAHLTQSRRTAEVAAETGGDLAVLSADRLSQWIERNPAPGARVALNLARILAFRLAAATEMAFSS